MALTDAQKLKYYRNKRIADSVILKDAAEDKHVIYGAKAINAQLPASLNVPTDDFDIFTSRPKEEARETERKLDKAYGGNYFRVEKARYEHTWKVKSNVTNKTVADYTKPTIQKIPAVAIRGNKYAKLSWMKGNIKRSLKDKNNIYRFDKDYDALQRIKLYEKNKEFLLE